MQKIYLPSLKLSEDKKKEKEQFKFKINQY